LDGEERSGEDMRRAKFGGSRKDRTGEDVVIGEVEVEAVLEE
jgi:hypothetical protein